MNIIALKDKLVSEHIRKLQIKEADDKNGVKILLDNRYLLEINDKQYRQ